MTDSRKHFTAEKIACSILTIIARHCQLNTCIRYEKRLLLPFSRLAPPRGGRVLDGCYNPIIARLISQPDTTRAGHQATTHLSH